MKRVLILPVARSVLARTQSHIQTLNRNRTKSELFTLFALLICTSAFAVGSATAISQTAIDNQLARIIPAGRFRLQQIDKKWTFVDPTGKPFYSIGINHVDMAGYADPHGVNAYKDTVASKYHTEDAWAAAQRKRFGEWGINTIAAFSNIAEFQNRDIPFTVYIQTANGDTDYWDPVWEKEATARISEAAHLYKGNRNLLGYFIDNELPWTINLEAMFRPGSELYVMGKSFHHPHGSAELLTFLKGRYSSVDELRADFPSAKLPGTDWSTLNLSEVSLGDKATPRGQDTLDAWARMLAVRYFSVTLGALRAADPDHLNFGHKFIGGLAPESVVKAEAPFVDAISVDFYDTHPTSAVNGKTSSGFEGLMSIIPFDKILPTRDMLADWYRITDKPILIAEFGYRAEDSGLPNTVPPGVVVLANQKARAQAVENYANCAINTPYIVGIHYFELFDEPAAGRFDGENSNWGIVNSNDVPYMPVVGAMTHASRLASERPNSNYEAAPCAPVGIQNVQNPQER